MAVPPRAAGYGEVGTPDRRAVGEARRRVVLRFGDHFGYAGVKPLRYRQVK